MKEALFFLAGLGLGVGGTYIVLKGSYDRQLEDEVAELMNYTRKPKKGRKKASKRVTEASEEAEEESKKPEESRDENDEFKPQTIDLSVQNLSIQGVAVKVIKNLD